MSCSITPFRTHGVFGDLRSDFDSIVRQLFNNEGGTDAGKWFTPRVDLAESDDGYEVTMDLPGLSVDDVQLELKQGQLFISGERTHTATEEGKSWHRLERHAGQFRRVLTLGDDVDAEKVEAEYRDGVLTVTVPKSAAASRRINIKT